MPLKQTALISFIPESDGLIICVAKNDLGTNRKAANIIVTDSVPNPSIALQFGPDRVTGAGLIDTRNGYSGGSCSNLKSFFLKMYLTFFFYFGHKNKTVTVIRCYHGIAPMMSVLVSVKDAMESLIVRMEVTKLFPNVFHFNVPIICCNGTLFFRLLPGVKLLLLKNLLR